MMYPTYLVYLIYLIYLYNVSNLSVCLYACLSILLLTLYYLFIDLLTVSDLNPNPNLRFSFFTDPLIHIYPSHIVTALILEVSWNGDTPNIILSMIFSFLYHPFFWGVLHLSPTSILHPPIQSGLSTRGAQDLWLWSGAGGHAVPSWTWRWEDLANKKLGVDKFYLLKSIEHWELIWCYPANIEFLYVIWQNMIMTIKHGDLIGLKWGSEVDELQWILTWLQGHGVLRPKTARACQILDPIWETTTLVQDPICCSLNHVTCPCLMAWTSHQVQIFSKPMGWFSS